MAEALIPAASFENHVVSPEDSPPSEMNPRIGKETLRSSLAMTTHSLEFLIPEGQIVTCGLEMPKSLRKSSSDTKIRSDETSSDSLRGGFRLLSD